MPPSFVCCQPSSLLTTLAEEEAKRQQAQQSGEFKEVAFQYDQGSSEADATAIASHEAETADVSLEVEEGFVVPAGVGTPPGMLAPRSSRHFQLIAKTAKFVAQQGKQMEIFLKAKQANNTNFRFLTFDDPLNPFYLHVVDMIAQGKYSWIETPAHPVSATAEENKDIGVEAATEPETKAAAPESEGGVVRVHGAVSLLGADYGDDEDDNEHDQASANGQAMVVLTSCRTRLVSAAYADDGDGENDSSDDDERQLR